MNKTPAEIFDPSRLSARFTLYQRDLSKRGRSLYLTQMLQHLKAEFTEFKEPLDAAITIIRAAGSDTEEMMEAKILKALRSYCATIPEISEETHISSVDVRRIIKHLVKRDLARKEKHPVSDNYRDDLYFLI